MKPEEYLLKICLDLKINTEAVKYSVDLLEKAKNKGFLNRYSSAEVLAACLSKYCDEKNLAKPYSFIAEAALIRPDVVKKIVTELREWI